MPFELIYEQRDTRTCFQLHRIQTCVMKHNVNLLMLRNKQIRPLILQTCLVVAGRASSHVFTSSPLSPQTTFTQTTSQNHASLLTANPTSRKSLTTFTQIRTHCRAIEGHGGLTYCYPTHPCHASRRSKDNPSRQGY